MTSDLERDLIALVAIADKMYAEHAAVEQKRSDDSYMAEFGHNGPSLASPLDSAGRAYVYNRHKLNDLYPDLDVPRASVALGQMPPKPEDYQRLLDRQPPSLSGPKDSRDSTDPADTTVGPDCSVPSDHPKHD